MVTGGSVVISKLVAGNLARSAGAGLVALIWPGLATLVLLYMITFWAVFTGILEIMAAIRLRNEITNEWFLALSGVLSIVLGFTSSCNRRPAASPSSG